MWLCTSVCLTSSSLCCYRLKIQGPGTSTTGHTSRHPEGIHQRTTKIHRLLPQVPTWTFTSGTIHRPTVRNTSASMWPSTLNNFSLPVRSTVPACARRAARASTPYAPGKLGPTGHQGPHSSAQAEGSYNRGGTVQNAADNRHRIGSSALASGSLSCLLCGPAWQ